MAYIRTIISFDENDYYSLKEEAAKRRQSLSAVVREKVRGGNKKDRSKTEVEKLMAQIRAHAKKTSKYLKRDGVTIIREMRDNAKW